MDCVYINLESRPDRRQRIESSFASSQIDGWSLTRFNAVDAAWVLKSKIQGAIRPPEKACFISHQNLIIKQLSSDRRLMVLEDDAVFGANTCQVIDASLASVRDADWDIIFTDIGVPDVGAWPDLVRLRRQFDETKALKLLSLQNFHFAGATSYILNPRSKRLLAELLDEVEQIDTPYDIYLRSLIHQGRLRAFVIFPFVTSVSELAEQSSIQTPDNTSLDLVLNWFRRAIWAERDLDQVAAQVAPLRQAYNSPETFVFGALFEAMLSEKIQHK